jgi:hypothetical protein
MDIITWFSVMFAVALGDVCWTRYFIEASKKRAISAGLWSAAIIALGSYSIVEYTQNHTLFTAAVIGAFLGTAGTVEWEKRRGEKKNV